MSDELINRLIPYVPALIIRRLAADPRPIKQPTAERLAVAVLFIDITDFTALSDRISEPGVVASERLADILIRCFGRLIDIIQAHGGEVTKFAGDALIALWPVPDHVLRFGSEAQDAQAMMARRAAQCGLDIQESIRSDPVVEDLNISLQVGVGAGDVYSVHLGGVLERWEFLLSGSPLVQMSLAKEQARPGSVVLSPEVHALIEGNVETKPLEDGFVELTQIRHPLPNKSISLPALSSDARSSLKAYIPAAIYNTLEAGHEAWSSEMRRVAVLFIKLPNYGTSIKHPYMRTLPEAQAVMEAIQEAIYRYAGSINKFNVDDKGITLVAAMGLPPLSHEDDAARAVHAAIEVQTSLKKLGRKSAIGLTTGWVFCGPVGNEVRQEYTMVGQVVNMAARLMQAAEVGFPANNQSGNILCDEATYQVIVTQKAEGLKLASRIGFKRMPGIVVKGKTETVVAYQPLLESKFVIPRVRRSIPPSKIVGHISERNQLEDSLEWLKSSPGSGSTLVVMEGEAGSGKSLLLEELLVKARRLNINALHGVGDALEPTTPYFAWRPIFQQLFNLHSSYDDPDAWRTTVLQQLPAIRGERGFPAFAIQLSPLLNSVLPLNFPENRTTMNMSAENRRRTTRLFLLRLIQRYVTGTTIQKTRPTLLVLDNGQWLDDASWELAITVSQQVEPLVMVIASRPLCEQYPDMRIARVCRRLQIVPNVGWIRLQALSEDETHYLLCQELKVKTVSPDVISLLMRKTGGHPQYVLELTRDWLRRGSLVVRNGECSSASDPGYLEVAPLPLYVHQTIIGRVERLIPAQQLVLKIASTIGSQFELDSLMQRYPIKMQRDELLGLLQELEETQFVAAVPGESALTFRFRSELVKEVAHGLLPVSRRSFLSNRSEKRSVVLPSDSPAEII